MKIPVSELLEECFDDQIHFQEEDEALDQNWKEHILEQIRQHAELQRKHRFTKYLLTGLVAAATVGKGITRLDAKQQAQCIKLWKEFQSGGAVIEKFQPASGAASRMFKNLFAFINEGKSAPESDFEKQFFDNITQFAFYPQLNKTCVNLYKSNVGELVEAGRYADVLKALLMPEGMNYGALPKALLKFHRAAAGTVHTPQPSLREHPLHCLARAPRGI